jgi:hypothetical protein
MTAWGEANGDSERVDAARQLILIARNLRAAGDVNLVQFSEDGISEESLTLAGELELIAMGLDYAGCMKGALVGPDDDPQLGRPES